MYGHDKYDDITADVKALASTLQIGQLAKDSTFTLASGVHALEIGNDKMDTGLQYMPLCKELESVPKVESSKDVILLVDMLAGCDLSWHRGSMILQNIASCVYVESTLHQLQLLNSDTSGELLLDQYLAKAAEINSWMDVLKAYILGLIKCLDLSCSILYDVSSVYPEEDIILNNAGFYFLEGIPIERIIYILGSAVKWTLEKGDEHTSDVANRLELRKTMICLLNDRNPISLTSSHIHVKQALKLLGQHKDVEKSDKFIPAFSQGVQSRVANSSPLRPLVRDDKPYETLAEVLKDIENFSTLNEAQRSTDTLSFFLTFSAKRPRTLPIVRALLHSSAVIGSNLLGRPTIEWVKKDLQEMTCPESDSILTRANKFAPIKGLLDAFLHQASLCYSDLVVIMCQNRSRQRQNLGHCILTFDSLHVSAEQLEAELEQAVKSLVLAIPGDDNIPMTLSEMPISSWVYLRKLQIMIWVVLLGFELDVYKLWEYSRMYYYANFLISALNNHLGRIRLFLDHKRQQLNNTRAKDKRRNLFQRDLVAIENSIGYIEALEIESTALNQLCIANLYLAVGLEELGLIQYNPTKSVATTDDLVYDLRFKQFSSVGVPEFPKFDEFNARIDTIKKSGTAIADAKKAATSCRILIDNLTQLANSSSHQPNPELELLKRSSVGIAVACLTVERQDKAAIFEKLKAEIKFDGYHWFFPVISCVSK